MMLRGEILKRMDPIVAIDFDGTLYKNGSVDKALIVAMEYLREKESCRFILWTCRSGKALDDALESIGEDLHLFDTINEDLPEVLEVYPDSGNKVFAHYYYDDQIIGGLPPIEELLSKVKEFNIVRHDSSKECQTNRICV